MEELEGNEVVYVMEGGFSFVRLHDAAYSDPLRLAFEPIDRQNAELIGAARKPGFDAADALEANQNGAVKLIRTLFEVIADYEEGRVPHDVAEGAILSTEKLIETLQDRPDAPVDELEEVRIAFRSATSIWQVTYPSPRLPRKCYIEDLMAARDNILKKLGALHLAYVRAKRVKRPKPSSRRTVATRSAQVAREDRQAVLRKIDTLCGKGYGVRRAIECLKRDSYWHSRMNGRSVETWRVYFTDWKNR